MVLFPQERAVVLREYADGIYSSPAFFLGKIITVIMFQIINGLIFGTILYWMAGLVPRGESFLLYSAVAVLVGSISVVLGIGIGTLLPSVDLASSIVFYDLHSSLMPFHVFFLQSSLKLIAFFLFLFLLFLLPFFRFLLLLSFRYFVIFFPHLPTSHLSLILTVQH